MRTETEINQELEGNTLSIDEAFKNRDLRTWIFLRAWRQALQWVLNEKKEGD